VKRLVVGAHYGTGGFLAQRITAIFIAAYALILGVALCSAQPNTYAAWRELFSRGWMRIATLILVASLVWHAWVGVRDILMDYIKPDWLRLALQVLTLLLLAVYLAWAAQILWR
jgi:succinate dehydrogenase / fumarate reductase membrane anchor subunit